MENLSNEHAKFYLTDIQVHAVKHRRPKSFYSSMIDSARTHGKKRVYMQALKLTMADGSTKVLLISPTGSDMVEENGEKLQMLLHKNPTIKSAPDLIEHIKGQEKQKRKRQWKKLDKFL